MIDRHIPIQTNKPELSIVIPVYNGREYIAGCVQSLLQLTSSCEILLIDDGSTDGSDAYMQETFRDIANCRILHQENAGIPAARNYGLAQASGEYVIFIDQDDRPVAGTIDHALQRCRMDHSDMGYWSTMCDRDGNITACDLVLQDSTVERDIICREIIPTYLSKSSNSYVTAMNHIWGGLFRRDIIEQNQLSFRRYVAYEDDYLFILDYLMFTERISFLSDTGYYWVRYYRSTTSVILQYVTDWWSKETALYDYVYGLCRANGIVIPETMTTYVHQSMPLFALLNYALVSNPNRQQELREWRQHMQDPEIQVAYRRQSIRNYTGRERRLFELLRHRRYTMAIWYACADARYHHLRARMHGK